MAIVQLTKEQLEGKWQFVQNYLSAKNNASASSVDANANVTSKNVATMKAEINKDFEVQEKRYFVSKFISKLFGEDTEKAYHKDIEDHLIYVHDESGIFYPYCASISMYPFLSNGMRPLGGESDAPKHLHSFCGSFNNLVYATAAQFAGAVATVEFLLYLDYYAAKDFGKKYLKKNSKEIENALQGIVHCINQPAVARGSQSVFWNVGVLDHHYLKHLFEDFVFPDGTSPDLERLYELQKFFLTWLNKERSRALLTFPVVTASMLCDDEKPLDNDFSDFIAKEMAEGNLISIYQSDSVDSLSSCCRLRNALAENVFSSTLGAGGIMTGSLNVITINCNRLVQSAVVKGIVSEDDILKKLKEVLERVYKYQVATKEYLTMFKDAGLMPVYDEHFLDMSKQFLTIGLNGLVEAAEFLGMSPVYTDNKYVQFVENFLKTIRDHNKKFSKHYHVSFNTEFVPAENAGVKNYNWDKEDGLVVNPERNCYNSYLYDPAADNISIIDKMRLHGEEVADCLDGGSAVHLNLEEHPTKEAYKKLMCVAAKTKCKYWVTNILSTACEDCGRITKSTRQSCSYCGSPNISYVTRIIGYPKKISCFSEARQIEASKRFYHKS